MKILKFILLILLIIVLNTCATTPGKNPAASLVPADAILYIQAGNADQLIGNTDEFLSTTGLSQQLGNISARSFLDLMFGMSMKEMNLDWINLEKPIAFAMLPPQPGSDEWDNALVTIPLSTDGLENYDKFIKLIQGKSKSKLYNKQVKDYLVLCSQPWIPEQTPPAKGIDSRKIDAYAPGSVSLYFSLDKLLKAAGKTWEELDQEITSELLQNLSGTRQERNQMQDLFSFYLDFLKDIQDMTINLVVDGKALAFRTDITGLKNGKIQEFNEKIPGNKNTKALLKYLPGDSFLSFASAIPFTAFEKMYMDMYNIIGIDDALTRELLDATKTIYDNIGPGMACSYNFDLDFKTIAQLEDLDFQTLGKIDFDKLFSIDIFAVTEIKNREKIRDFYKNFQFDKLINKMLDNLLKKELGDTMSLKMDMKMKQDMDDAGFKYDMFTFGLKLDVPQNGANDQLTMAVAQALLNKIMEKFTLYMHYTADKCYMVFGYRGLQTLKETVANDGFKEQDSLTGSPAAGRLLSLMPDTSDVIYQLSLIRFFNLLVSIPALKMVPIDIEDAPGLMGYMDFNKNSIFSMTAWDSKEIGKILIQLLPLFQALGKASDVETDFDPDI